MDATCNSTLVYFSSFYETYVHGCLCFAICIAGSVCNIINIIVFTRKHMVSPTNVVLTSLAIADTALLLSYIPAMLVDSISYTEGRRWSIYALFFARFVSIWMTLVLALWRYLAVVHPLKARNWCNMKTTYRTVVAVYVLCLLIQFRTIIFWTDFLIQVYNWCFGIIPVIALPVLTLRLVCALWKAKKNRRKLMPNFVQPNTRDSDVENQMNRTTRMLLVVLSFFVIPMLLYEIVFLIQFEVLHHDLRRFLICFVDLGNFFDMLMLLDAATNFLVYYVMSCQFRKTCHILFNCNTFAAAKNLQQNQANDEVTTQTTSV